MRRRHALLLTAASLSIAAVAHGRSKHRVHRLPPGEVAFHTPFALLEPPVAPPADTASAPAPTGSTIAALGGGALVIDEDSGELVRMDGDGQPAARLRIGAGAGQLVVDHEGATAYVADRAGDRVVVVDVAAGALRRVRDLRTPREPYGLALTPDGGTLLVTAVADRALVAFDTRRGERRWSVDIGPGARGVAVAPDGGEAIVTYLTVGAVARIDLERERPRVRYVALDDERPLTGAAAVAAAPAAPAPQAGPQAAPPQQKILRKKHAVSQAMHFGRIPRSEGFARGAFAAVYAGSTAVVGYQRATPDQTGAGVPESPGAYGGAALELPPVVHRLAFVARRPRQREVARAHIQLHQPRAMAYAPAADALYVAGLGNDTLVRLDAASTAGVYRAWQVSLTASGERCGPTGVAVADGGDVLVYCSFRRRVARIEGEGAPRLSSELARTRLSARARLGRELFHTGGDPKLSRLGAMACATCHPEGRSDGLSWRIQGVRLQTPLLAGRVAGTHPFKWDGQDADLMTSLTQTVLRLGGTGIDARGARALAAYLDTLPAPRPPTPASADRVARGKALFESDTVGCARCHAGPKLTDRARYDLAADLEAVDTPSLLGLASSAPYYHDGSAASLRALLLENGTVHGMGRTGGLDAAQVEDLVAYLEQL